MSSVVCTMAAVAVERPCALELRISRWVLSESLGCGNGRCTPQTLEGSFSAVSTPIFATKYSFCSIFRYLQDLQTFAPLRVQNLLIFFSQNFAKFHRMLEILIGLMLQTSQFQNFLRKSRKFAETFCRNSA